ncbi:MULTISPECIES: ABC transporter ATP-binding protein [Pseudomonas]|jgi:branched-chain amino acid transport system permease protein|uniref:Amino acid/amide ABC transporter membrane protein 2 (HAAT family) n=2 Tax=Pseudomonas TaxID=286 RepID=A0A9X8EIZ7_PSEPU|nr:MULTISPECIES: ABC transporter ATP-binding protein [Pseudomonas]KIU45131.1 ABC transporter ATP-binding protein [Pseudomonas putida]KTC25191.1 ABC transporter ATP-binding protein [Pseudomonas putida]MBG8561193.1 ABC transporter ATP-binding protein [Pseudomonas qingdaonensis]MCO7505505.1 ABC transporter ATP-binding protein [Pseudomonas sp. VE 267-6A]MCO7528382.1 ABC transporter ATP-binding protein [Pseudomonas sp. 2]
MKNQTAQYLLLILAFVALPFVVDSIPFLGPTWVRILGFAMLYVLLALGLNIVIGYAGLLDMGYIGFYAIGAYLYALLASPHLNMAGLVDGVLNWPLWVIIPLAAIAAAICGVLIGAPVLKLRGDYLAIVTLGFGEIIRIFMNNLDQPVNITNGPQGISNIAPLHIDGGAWSHAAGQAPEALLSLQTSWSLFGLKVTPVISYYLFFLVVVIFAIVLSKRLEVSRIGRAWMALREDEVAAEAMGLNKRNLKLLAFAMGATFGGVSGVLFSSYQGFVSPESFTLMESIMVLAMVVLGGMGSIRGVVLGALILSVMPEVFRDLVNWIQPFVMDNVTFVSREVLRNVLDASTLRMLVFGLALILVMRYRPEGLWPSNRRRAELHDGDPEPTPAATALSTTVPASTPAFDHPAQQADKV